MKSPQEEASPETAAQGKTRAEARIRAAVCTPAVSESIHADLL